MTSPYMAFLITLLTGLTTGIGGLFVFFPHNKNTIFLSISLTLSGIIMIYMSLFEILPNAFEQFQTNTNISALIPTIFYFILGIICISFIDYFLAFFLKKQRQNEYLLRIGFITFLILTIHNIPEGFITFISLLEKPLMGIPIALTIALHNIPEGIAIAVPVYILSNNQTTALLVTLCSGLAEPLGAILGYSLLKPYISADILGLIYAGIAGIMCFISLHDLLPASRNLRKNTNHFQIY